jgi:hypothetical protein
MICRKIGSLKCKTVKKKKICLHLGKMKKNGQKWKNQYPLLLGLLGLKDGVELLRA